MSGYFDYWGKAGSGDDDPSFHRLTYHSLDVAAVAMELLERDEHLATRLSSVSGFAAEALRGALPFLLGLHDLGKFSEPFQGLKPVLMARLQGVQSAPSCDIRHDSLGYLLWREWASIRVDPREAGLLGDLLAIDVPGEALDRRDRADLLQPWMAAVLSHHGRPPIERPLPANVFTCRPDRPLARSRLDAAAFVRDLGALLKPAPLVAHDSQFDATLGRMKRSSWWLAGFSILCDWLGSNSQGFRYEPRELSLEEYWGAARAAAAGAVKASGLCTSIPRRFAGISGLLPGRVAASPTPLQRAASDVDLGDGPQLYLLEDLTGSGKTEAALILTQRLMSAGLADGFFFALPTMATANAMAPRIEPLVERFFDGEPSFLLSHSGPRLTEADHLALAGRSGDVSVEPGEPSGTATGSSWLADRRKKALLAQAGVGTIDQALLAILQNRHAALRMFGLHRHVLVVDEVHACDAYMLGVLSALLRAHAALGGSAILLSATLPLGQRRRLAGAFASGLGERAPSLAADAYPLLTAVAPGRTVERPVPARDGSPRTVPIVWHGTVASVVDRIVAATRGGQCACWIRNSVKDALEGHDALAARLPSEQLTLFHARFALGDRLRIEQGVVSRFGIDGDPRRGGHVVVATQVVEQSLDVDFDVMVTDLCPVDLVIQRAGRLQRHAERHLGREPPVLEIFAPDWFEEPPACWLGGPFRRTALVYDDPGVLWRTMRALRQAGRLSVPGDARRLVEAVYGDADGDPLPPSLERRSAAAAGEELAHESVARAAVSKLDLGYLREGADWSSEARTPTRLGEPTTTLRLAKVDPTGAASAWEDRVPDHRWPLSQVSVARRVVAGPAPEDEDSLLALEGDQPFTADDVVTVLLHPASDGSWEGRAVAERKVNGTVRQAPVRLRYSRERGLSVDQEG